MFAAPVCAIVTHDVPLQADQAAQVVIIVCEDVPFTIQVCINACLGSCNHIQQLMLYLVRPRHQLV